MNVGFQNMSRTLFAGAGGMMKSTQDKMERQEKCASQVSFFENQKENLKTMACSSLEEIARKLEMFHSYEDQIAAAKQAYNNSQMTAVLDEARERGEKIAEAAEKAAPKTPEERREEMLEEATDSEESKGMLSEIMDEMTEMIEEAAEEMQEEMLEENLDENAAAELEENAALNLGDKALENEKLAKGLGEQAADNLNINAAQQTAENIQGVTAGIMEDMIEQEMLMRQKDDPGMAVYRAFDEESLTYRHIDYRL